MSRALQRIDALLAEASAKLKKSGIASDDAPLLLAHCMGVTKESLLTHSERELNLAEQRYASYLIAERCKGYSIAVLTGSREFYGHKFYVTKDTLVPRPESELLVNLAIVYLRKRAAGSVLDIGTGSGNLIISIASALGRSKFEYYASDIAEAALAVAERNARAHRVDVRFFYSNLFENIPKKKFSCIVANLPYLTAEQLAEPSIKYEPIGALWGGTRGTELYQHFLSEVEPFLNPHGMVCIEIDPDQKNALMELARTYFPTATIDCLPDLSSRSRVIQIQNPDPDTLQ